MYALDILIDFTLLIKLNLREVKPICNWIPDFRAGRPQVVRVGRRVSAKLTVSTGVPQGCCLSPKLFPLHTHDCGSTQDSATILGLISQGRLQENNKCHPVLWGGEQPQPQHRKNPPKRNHSRLQEESCPLQPLAIKGAEVDKDDNRTFPGLQLTSDLSQTLKAPATAGRGTSIDQTAQEGWTRLCPLTRAYKELLRRGVSTGHSLQHHTDREESSSKGHKDRRDNHKVSTSICGLCTCSKVGKEQRESSETPAPTQPSPTQTKTTQGTVYSRPTHNTSVALFRDTRIKWSALCAIQSFPSQYLSPRTTFSSEIYFICVPSA